MTGGFVLNPFSSLRTRAEDLKENKAIEAIIATFCSTTSNGTLYSYIGGKNKTNDIFPIGKDTCTQTQTVEYDGETTQFINSLNNYFTNVDVSKIGVFVNILTNTPMEQALKSIIIPLQNLINEKTKNHRNARQYDTTCVDINTADGITGMGPRLTRETLKEINGGKRSSEGGRQPFKYLYVIGKCEQGGSETKQVNQKPHATMNFAIGSPPQQQQQQHLEHSGAAGWGGGGF